MNGGSKSTNIQITAIAINGPRLEIEFHFFLLMCEMHFGDFLVLAKFRFYSWKEYNEASLKIL